MKWQIVIAALLLIAQSAVLLMPRMQVSGERFMSAVMAVNRKAEEVSAGVAKEAGAYEITDNYERGTSMREQKAAEYQDKLKSALNGRPDYIDGVQLGIWCLTTDADISFSGINWRENSYFRLSSLQRVFRLMALLLFFPSVLGLFTILFMLIRRRTPRTLLLLNGILGVAVDVAWIRWIPELIWEKVSQILESYEMVNEQVLLIPEVGQYSITVIMQKFAANGFYIHGLLGIFMILLSLAYFTVWRPERELVEIDEIHCGKYEPETLNKWEVFPMVPMPDEIRPARRDLTEEEKAELIFPIQLDNCGYIQGVKGQLRGVEIAIQSDKEVVIGNGLEPCDLVIEHPLIARRHCGVRYDPVTGQYHVIAYTNQEIAMSNGKKLRVDSYTMALAGTMLYLAGDGEVVRLG